MLEKILHNHQYKETGNSETAYERPGARGMLDYLSSTSVSQGMHDLRAYAINAKNNLTGKVRDAYKFARHSANDFMHLSERFYNDMKDAFLHGGREKAYQLAHAYAQALPLERQQEMADKGYEILQKRHGNKTGQEIEKQRKKHKGFTLIELLVTIAIISVLAGFLVPPVVEARKKANRSACINHLQQIGVAIQTYVHDYEGWLPTADMTLSTIALWNGDSYGNYGKLHAGGYVGDGRIFYCPSAGQYKVDSSSYGVQNLGVSGKSASSSYYQRGPNQGAPITIGEAGTKVLLSDYERKNPMNTGKKVVWNHKDVVQALFGDCHVKSVLGDWDCANTDGYGGDSAPGAGDGFWSQMDARQ